MIKLLSACCFFIAGLSATVSAQSVDKVVAAHYPPLMIEGDPDRPGYAIEVLEEAAQRAGRKIELSFLPFQRAMEAVVSEPATLMPALFFGEQRKDQFSWVAEIQSANLIFATTSEQINSFDAARALRSIVVEQGSTSEIVLTALGFDNLIIVVSPASSARMLSAGRVEAWFQTRTIVGEVWQGLALSEPLVTGARVHGAPIYLVSGLQVPQETSSAYQQAVESMRDDGTLDALWARYDDR